jgi:hypothetical protein
VRWGDELSWEFDVFLMSDACDDEWSEMSGDDEWSEMSGDDEWSEMSGLPDMLMAALPPYYQAT